MVMVPMLFLPVKVPANWAKPYGFEMQPGATAMDIGVV
jgi:hypothetical protein